MLAAAKAKAVDFIITQDGGLHKRAERAGLASSVFTIEEALAWLRQTYLKQRVALPDIQEVKAYQIDRSDPIFASLRSDYPDFDTWFDKCCQQHRDCWALRVDGQIAGLMVRKEESHDEMVMERPLLHTELPTPISNSFDFDRKFYPRVYDGGDVRKFCVPIQPDYHRRLFPEIAFSADLPLFPSREFDLRVTPGLERKPGNTVRKVYLCRAKTTRLRPGDLVFFYVSKDKHYAASQSITTLGVVEQTNLVSTLDDLLRLTAKRSVFTAIELDLMLKASSAPILAIDFLLVGHIEPHIALDALLHAGIFNRAPPQSISELDERRYSLLRSKVDLGFPL